MTYIYNFPYITTRTQDSYTVVQEERVWICTKNLLGFSFLFGFVVSRSIIMATTNMHKIRDILLIVGFCLFLGGELVKKASFICLFVSYLFVRNIVTSLIKASEEQK